MLSVIEKLCLISILQNAFVYTYTKNGFDLLMEPIMCFDNETSDNDRIIVIFICLYCTLINGVWHNFQNKLDILA